MKAGTKVEKVLDSVYVEDSFGNLVTLLMEDGTVVKGWGLDSRMTGQDIWEHNYATDIQEPIIK